MQLAPSEKVTEAGDKAAQLQEMHLKIALANRKQELPAKGECYNCLEPLAQGVFCDADCRQDHELRTRR